jgi:signal peptidase II
LRTITRTLFVSILFLVCVGCDQVTKGVVRAHVVLGESQSFLSDTVRLTHAENTGAFLSLGDALPDQMKSTLFIIGVGLISLAVFLAALFMRRLSHWQVAALSLIASGGIGNWIDRLTHDGRVSDFLNVGIGSLRTGIFNVADMVLMIGVVLFFVGSGRQAAANKSQEHARGDH